MTRWRSISFYTVKYKVKFITKIVRIITRNLVSNDLRIEGEIDVWLALTY